MAIGNHVVTRLPRSEALARHLEEMIIEQGLHPGHRLGSRTELRHRFQVAAATVSEALRILEARGVAQTRPGPGGGVFVAASSTRVHFRSMVLGFKVDGALYADVLVVRNALEPLVCHDALRNCSLRDTAGLRAIVEEMAAATHDASEYMSANWRLHRRLANMSPNPALKSMYLTLLEFVEDGFQIAWPDETFQPARNLQTHRDLIEAIIHGEAVALDDALVRHMPESQRQPVIEPPD